MPDRKRRSEEGTRILWGREVLLVDGDPTSSWRKTEMFRLRPFSRGGRLKMAAMSELVRSLGVERRGILRIRLRMQQRISISYRMKLVSALRRLWNGVNRRNYGSD